MAITKALKIFCETVGQNSNNLVEMITELPSIKIA